MFRLKEAKFKLTHEPEGGWNFKVKASQEIGEKGVLTVDIEKKGETFNLHGKSLIIIIVWFR